MEMESTASTTRAALGSSAFLGQLYDARRDDLCGISIFKKAIPAAAITQRDTPFSDVTLLHSDDYSAKFTNLDVNAEQQVSVLSGLYKLEGSGRYLNDQKKSARAVKGSIIFSIKTKEESLNIYHEEVKEAFSIDAIQTGVATHVVVGISWGANSILTCQFDNKENADITEVDGRLFAHMNKLLLSINGQVSEGNEDENPSAGLKMDVRMFGDIVAANDPLPTTAEGALEVLKKLPSLVLTSNGGKGKPLSYRLLPISTLNSYLNLTVKVDAPFKSLKESTLLRLVRFFDEISKAKQKLHDLHHDAADFSYCILPEDYQTVMDIMGKIEVEESKLRCGLATALTDVRSGRSDDTKIEDLLQKFQQSEMSPQKVATLLSEWSSLIGKINFARTLVQNGVKYIGKGLSLDDELLQVSDQKVFLLYFSQSSATEDRERLQRNEQLFLKEVKQGGNKYIAVDCDFQPNLMRSDKKSVLKVLEAGQVLCQDLLEEKQLLKNSPLVKTTSSAQPAPNKPNKRVPLAIACTGDTCDPSAVYEWICYKCKKPVDYGFDQFIYCSCGKTPASSLEFRCPDPSHGLTFKQHDTTLLEKLLESLRDLKEINILILGETGVGKSTWINSFVNFLHFDTLEEAAGGGLITLIPTKFTVVNDNYEEIEVKAGEQDANELLTAGQSSTQSSKVYPFIIGDTVVRLIDTPGIGDTRGVDKDKENFENILGTLSYHDEIHGICILLKPNTSKLSVTFRFCVKELLTYLHKDASKNIIFCFTNSRGTFYKPGDTLPALRKLLSENENLALTISKQTMYGFDSECYRFLAAIQNKPPVSFTDSERRDFSSSWQTSMNETKRMFEHIKTLPPHKTNSMINLNFSRKLVLKLSRPLADITRNIQLNKAVVLEEMEEIRGMDENIAKLMTRRMMKRTVVQNTRIPYPKTVCTHTDCVEMRSLSDQGEKVVFYKQICHAHCYIKGVQEDVIGHALLMHCDAMDPANGVICRHCSHRYNVHAHFWYDSTLVEVEMDDKSVADSLKRNRSAAEMKREMISKRENEVDEYESELKEIENASVRFAYFLKTNAITPHNDAMEQYLEHLIREENNKLAAVKGRSRATLIGLEKSLSSYIVQRDILENAMQKGTSGERPPTGADVQELVYKLKALKHSGRALTDALDAVQSSQNVVYNEVRQAAVVRQAPEKNFFQKIFGFLRGNWQGGIVDPGFRRGNPQADCIDERFSLRWYQQAGNNDHGVLRGNDQAGIDDRGFHCGNQQADGIDDRALFCWYHQAGNNDHGFLRGNHHQPEGNDDRRFLRGYHQAGNNNACGFFHGNRQVGGNDNGPFLRGYHQAEGNDDLRFLRGDHQAGINACGFFRGNHQAGGNDDGRFLRGGHQAGIDDRVEDSDTSNPSAGHGSGGGNQSKKKRKKRPKKK